MRLNLKFPWSALIAIPVGIIVLLGTFLKPSPASSWSILRSFFLQTGVILAAAAMLVGVIHLMRVHTAKIRQKSAPAGSLLLLVALIGTFVLGTVDYYFGWLETPAKSYINYVFQHIQLPVERSLFALLAVVLALAAMRLLRRRITLFTGVFLLTFMLLLISAGPVIPVLSDTIRPWLLNVPVVSGVRGLILGIALGSIAAGMRVLLGADRPYSG